METTVDLRPANTDCTANGSGSGDGGGGSLFSWSKLWKSLIEAGEGLHSTPRRVGLSLTKTHLSPGIYFWPEPGLIAVAILRHRSLTDSSD